MIIQLCFWIQTSISLMQLLELKYVQFHLVKQLKYDSNGKQLHVLVLLIQTDEKLGPTIGQLI